jgi:hypothetical protein
VKGDSFSEVFENFEKNSDVLVFYMEEKFWTMV